MVLEHIEHSGEEEFDDDDLFFLDKLEHYFGRPQHPAVENLSYFEYYCRFECYLRPGGRKTGVVGRDKYGYTVVKRRQPRLHRVTTRRIEDGEVFWYQRLLDQYHWRSEEELLGGYESYREHFCQRWPDDYAQLQIDIQTLAARALMELSRVFAAEMAELLGQIDAMHASIIEDQLTTIQTVRPTPMLLEYSFNLQGDQYKAYNTLTTLLVQHKRQQGFNFFVTGGAGSGKTHLLHALCHWCDSRHIPYLKMAPTGIAACNIDGRTIHSALHISIGSTFRQSTTNILRTEESKKSFQKYRILIIDEVSMVHGDRYLYTPFGGLHVVCFGDLMQLPPVNGLPVYRSALWQRFIPIIIRGSFRQHDDPEYLDLLNHIRMGRLPNHVKTQFTRKYCGTLTDLGEGERQKSLTLQTTALVSLRADADTLNNLIHFRLPHNKYVVHTAIDREGSRVLGRDHSTDHLFRRSTNLPLKLTCLVGGRVMFLNNMFISLQISNGSCGVIIGFDSNDSPRVAFPVSQGIQVLTVSRITSYFQINGISYSRSQYPLQNAFALTVHKTQGLTLQKISVRLDETMFSHGHAYTALSRAKLWKNVDLLSLDWRAVRADPDAIKEYERLEELAASWQYHQVATSRTMQNPT